MSSRLLVLAFALGMAALECAAVPHRVYSSVMPAPSASVAIVGDLQRTLPGENVIREQNDLPRERLIADMVASNIKALLIAGDMVAWGASEESWSRFDTHLAPLPDKVPVLPALGNHDYYGPNAQAQANYRRRFCWLKEQTWYSKVWGSIGFIWLDSNADVLSHEAWQQQLDFYKAELAKFAEKDEVRGVIVLFHHAPYTNSALGPDATTQRDFVPPFCGSSKTLMLVTGHVHGYEHFVFGNCAGCGKRDRHFIVSGGGGGPRRSDYHPGTHWVDWFHTDESRRPFHYLLLTQDQEGVRVTVRGFQQDEPPHAIDEFRLAFAPKTE